MNKLISEKIEELIELAKIADDKNVQIILLALLGSRESGDDGYLAEEIQKFVRDVFNTKSTNKKCTIMNDKILQLRKEIEAEEAKIRNCKHLFNKSYFDPETIMEGYGSVQDGAGSDPHWSCAGYKQVEKNRWSRKCEKCGFTQYTYEQKPIIKGYEPSF